MRRSLGAVAVDRRRLLFGGGRSGTLAQGFVGDAMYCRPFRGQPVWYGAGRGSGRESAAHTFVSVVPPTTTATGEDIGSGGWLAHVRLSRLQHWVAQGGASAFGVSVALVFGRPRVGGWGPRCRVTKNRGACNGNGVELARAERNFFFPAFRWVSTPTTPTVARSR